MRHNLLIIIFLLMVFLSSGCDSLIESNDKSIELEEDSFDCYWDDPSNHFYKGRNMDMPKLLAKDLSKYQLMLDNNDLNVFNELITDKVIGGLSLDFIDTSFEVLVSNACSNDCSKVACEYFKILTTGSKLDCTKLPKKTFITDCYRLGIMEGHRQVCNNVTVNYQDTCYFLKSLEEKYAEEGFCQKIPDLGDYNYYYTGRCITKKAIYENDPQLCESIESEVGKDRCIENVKTN